MLRLPAARPRQSRVQESVKQRRDPRPLRSGTTTQPPIVPVTIAVPRQGFPYIYMYTACPVASVLSLTVCCCYMSMLACQLFYHYDGGWATAVACSHAPRCACQEPHPPGCASTLAQSTHEGAGGWATAVAYSHAPRCACQEPHPPGCTSTLAQSTQEGAEGCILLHA